MSKNTTDNWHREFNRYAAELETAINKEMPESYLKRERRKYQMYERLSAERLKHVGRLTSLIKGDIAAIEFKSDRAVVVMKDGRKFNWLLDRPGNLETLLGFGTWEPDETAVLRKLIRKGQTIFDIGTNFGWHATLFSRLTGAEGAVHGFEPIREYRDEALANLALNGCANVAMHACALSDRRGSGTMYIPKLRGGTYASLRMDSREDHYTEEPCETMTLDDFCREHAAGQAHFIKIDTEGAELPILQGASRLLEQGRPALMIELDRRQMDKFGYSCKDLERFLKQYRYSMHVAFEEQLVALPHLDDVYYCNLFCLPGGEGVEGRWRR
ncbi:FkbM family methyltransferase [Paenibacillus sp. HB172176]|uniref:FkbM family methyltransferase n=1 Tax=Paenibacillus sp. HB172176 TaxID=2493690 RepID=UPI00143C06BB|nr:FkbM family methyltransferase [Paenibacillus sp. HB172176]